MIDGDMIFVMECNGSSKDDSGNSAILSIRGALTETSGDFSLVRMSLPCFFSGVLITGRGSDVRLAARTILSTEHLDGGRCKAEREGGEYGFSLFA